ncbi:DUF2188 domain-containing protein [Microbacteriaceae bacterium VKM Ac-2855]|nr:DUF2188 domain-containing protein [Microbacteriaceae bacterium VKM Ac-2855]
MPAGDVETFHHDGAWHNRIETDTDVLGSYPTKAAAVAAGREIARRRRVEHIIRNENGHIADRSTYGHDPRHIKG